MLFQLIAIFLPLLETRKPGGISRERPKQKTGSSELFLGDLPGFSPAGLDTSSHFASPATGYAEACAVYLEDGVVGVLGGYTDTGKLLEAFDTYNTNTGQWKRLAGMATYIQGDNLLRLLACLSTTNV